MTIKTQHLSVKKYTTINGIEVPGIYITFPSYFKKMTNLEAKTIIGYRFENNMLKLTIEDKMGENTLRVNRGNSIFLSQQKCPELNLLNIPVKTQHVKFVVRGEYLILDLIKFKSEVKDFNEAKVKKAASKPSFQYYNEEENYNNEKNNDKKQIKMNLR